MFNFAVALHVRKMQTNHPCRFILAQKCTPTLEVNAAIVLLGRNAPNDLPTSEAGNKYSTADYCRLVMYIYTGLVTQ